MIQAKRMGTCIKCNKPMYLNDSCVGRALYLQEGTVPSTGPVWRQTKPGNDWTGIPPEQNVWHIDCKVRPRNLMTTREVQAEINYIALMPDYHVQGQRINALRELYRYSSYLFTADMIETLRELVERHKNPIVPVHYFFQE